MKRSLGLVLAVASLFVCAPAVTGCIVTQNSDGSVTLESGTTYKGSVAQKSVPYTAGQAVRIVGVNGKISVSTAGSSDVVASFQPFTLGKGDSSGEQKAKDEMNSYLQLSASSQGSEIVIQASRTGGSGNLGADISVTVPSALSGAFTVQQGNGDVVVALPGDFPGAVSVQQDNGDVELALGGKAASVAVTSTGAGDVSVTGASGRLAITGPFDVAVTVASWAGEGEDGSIKAGSLGTLSVRIPADVNGTLTAQAGASIKDGGISSSWASSGEGSSKSYTMGTGKGAKVALVAGEDIELSN
jgi:hypothetical protein